MPRKHEAEFANFILTLGDLGLIDIVEDLLVPALRSERIYAPRKSRYSFHDIEIISLGKDVFLRGNFAKQEMIIRRKNVIENEEKLIDDHTEFKQVYSTLFLISLANHRLIYFHETKSAPDLKTFRAAAREFIKDYYHAHIAEFPMRGVSNFSSGRLLAEPQLDVVPLVTKDSIESLINSYAKLEKLTITIFKTNNENDYASYLNDMREQGERVGAEEIKITETNKSVGLNQAEATELAASAAASGNSQIETSGKDKDGQSLRQKDDQMILRRNISLFFQGRFPSPPEVIEKLIQEFNRMIVEKEILPGNSREDKSEIYDQIRRACHQIGIEAKCGGG